MNDEDLLEYLQEEHCDSLCKIHYITIEQFVTVFFTAEAAEAYVKKYSYKLKDPYIYVDSCWDNEEIIAIRQHIKDLTPEVEKELRDSDK